MSRTPATTAQRMATEEEAIAWIDAHRGDRAARPPLPIERQLERMLGIPAMYDEWADPECSVCMGTGCVGDGPCICTFHETEAPQ